MRFHYVVWMWWVCLTQATGQAPDDHTQRVAAKKPAGSTQPLAPDAERATFRLPPGFHIDLVAAEPLLCEPVLCTWDADGKMYVAEMCTYMQDINGADEDAPKSRISMLHDDDGDGTLDRRTTFADGLVLPRLLLPLDDVVLVGETYTTALWSYRDADGDGVAEHRELLREGSKDARNLEHQDSALTYGIDNWLYTAMGNERFRWRGGAIEREELEREFAQWGLAVDDVGRQFLSAAGAERPAFGFQRHPRYPGVKFTGELADGFAEVFPAIATPDVQGGEERLRADGTLNHMTGCCGQSIFAGTALPRDCVGDYFVCEPVGRLLRRASVTDVDGRLVLANRYPGAEFLTSTDMNFRPVWTATGPDGALYVVDMYRGIIQEGNWVKPGSFLRPRVEALGLQHNVGRGRIWRIRAESLTPRFFAGRKESADVSGVRDDPGTSASSGSASAPISQPWWAVAVGHAEHARLEPPLRLRRATVDALVAALAHDNGFWRSTAQQLLVQRQLASAAPALRKLLAHRAPPTRVHALWTLDGLAAVTRDDLALALGDRDGRVRYSAVRVSEGFLARGDAGVLALLAPLAQDRDAGVAAQLALSLRAAPSPQARELVLAIAAHRPGHEVVGRAVRDSLAGAADHAPAFVRPLDADALALVRTGKRHYQQLCISCHGVDGSGTLAGGVFLAPPLVGSPRVLSEDAAIRVLLHGMHGPIDGKTWAGGVMAGQSAQDDQYLAAVLSYVRTVLADGGIVTPDEVAAVRAATSARTVPWTSAELLVYCPLPETAHAKWQASASHESGHAGRALDGKPSSRFTTEAVMQPGMWWRVDFDRVYELSRVVLDTRGSEQDYPRGHVLEGSLDGQTWHELAQGEGQGPVTSIRFPPTSVRHLRVTQTGTSSDRWWSIHEATFCGRALE
jgi:mono/diheme cytochrome c family protein/glucose/arabinose dehydrogenase